MRLHLTFLGLLAATATAYLDLGPLVARQTDAADVDSWTDGSGGDCLSALMDVAASAPRPPQEIIDVMTGFYMTATGSYDAVCGWQTAMPAEVADDWYAYQSKALSWYSEKSADLASALSHCPAGYESSVGVCTASITGLPPPGQNAGGGGAAATATSKNFAPRETGHVLVAGAAVAGFLGVVAAL